MMELSLAFGRLGNQSVTRDHSLSKQKYGKF